MPECTVTPVLPYPDVSRATDWLQQAFGFTVRLRIGDHRAQLNAGAGAIVVTQGEPGEHTASTMVRVEDVLLHCRQATEHGAHILAPPTDYPYGERQYTVKDPAGHCWTFSQTISDVDPSAWGGTLACSS